MKSLLRNVVINGVSLVAVTEIIDGVKITGGFTTFLFGGFILSILAVIVKPVLQLITLPFNLITFGSFSFLINVVLLYLLTVFIPRVQVIPFVFQGFTFWGFVVPKISFNSFFAFVVSAFVLSLIMTFIKWLIK